MSEHDDWLSRNGRQEFAHDPDQVNAVDLEATLVGVRPLPGMVVLRLQQEATDGELTELRIEMTPEEALRHAEDMLDVARIAVTMLKVSDGGRWDGLRASNR